MVLLYNGNSSGSFSTLFDIQGKYKYRYKVHYVDPKYHVFYAVAITVRWILYSLRDLEHATALDIFHSTTANII